MSKSKKKKNIIETLTERDVDVSQQEENSQAQKSQAILNADSLVGGNAGASADEISCLKAELLEAKDKHIRLLAEFDNYRKRVVKERSEMLKYQGENLIFDMLEVIDNLERALQHAEADPQSLKEGIELIFKRLNEILRKWEIRGESAVGKVFDPLIHQALSMVNQEGIETSIVLEELKKPYFYKDKLIRAGEVVVAVPLEKSSDNESALDKQGPESN